MKMITKSFGVLLILLSLALFFCGRKNDDSAGGVKEPGADKSELRKEKWVSVKEGLRLRSAPDQNSQILALMPLGAKLQILSEKPATIVISGQPGKWCEVIWEGKKGWTFSGFLSDRAPADRVSEVLGKWVLDEELDNQKQAGYAFVKLERTELTWARGLIDFKGEIVSITNDGDTFSVKAKGQATFDVGPDKSGTSDEDMEFKITLINKDKAKISTYANSKLHHDAEIYNRASQN